MGKDFGHKASVKVAASATKILKLVESELFQVGRGGKFGQKMESDGTEYTFEGGQRLWEVTEQKGTQAVVLGYDLAG
jgi:hypothetical protein